MSFRKTMRFFCAISISSGFMLTSGLCFPASAADDDPLPPEAAEFEQKESALNTGMAFFDDGSLGGGVYYFQRKRQRYNTEEGDWQNNLSHATVTGQILAESGLIGDTIGFDLGLYYTRDLYSHAAVDHEMNFVPWDDPYHPNWSEENTKNGASIHRALVKLRHDGLWANAGYFQPTGPSVMGVNWSIAPGIYQGAEGGYKTDKVELATTLVNAYKAPWYRKPYSFRDGDRETKIDYMWSVGARYHFTPNLTSEVAYGESDGFLSIGHFKTAYDVPLGEVKATFKYQLYGMSDSADDGGPNDLFDGLAFQHYIGSAFGWDQWALRLDGTYTKAPQNTDSNLGYFAYRLTVPTGSSKGAYDVWWDARSDWNHDQEKAVFVNLARSLDETGIKGLNVGIGFAKGWDAKAFGYDGKMREHAWTADFKYVAQEGRLEGASISLHLTRYYNSTDLPSWTYFKNGFEDEKDVKLFIAIPL